MTQSKTNVNEGDFGWLVILGLGIFVLGGFLGLLVCSTTGTTVVENQFLDKVCNETFGEGYVYYDDKSLGVDMEVTCKDFEEINKTEEWIGMEE